MDANIRRVERQLMANQTTQVQLDKYKVPCLWTLQDMNPNPSGFMARGKPLLRKEIRIVCLCELRDAKPCELYDDDLPLVKANSDLVKKVLPILKASSLVVQALGLVVDGTTTAVISSVNGIVEGLPLEEKLSSIVEAMDNDSNKITEDEVQTMMTKVKDALVEFRDDPETYRKLLSMLESINFQSQSKTTIGGLERKVVRVDDVKGRRGEAADENCAGEVRWVCKAHAESLRDRLV
ncbi:hypothetical protein Ae201684P_021625 [Aphanomyces euteiches]|nr:hypothetical protein Ae201684P_021625 [Aphanomyces euteiches]